MTLGSAGFVLPRAGDSGCTTAAHGGTVALCVAGQDFALAYSNASAGDAVALAQQTLGQAAGPGLAAATASPPGVQCGPGQTR